MFGQIEGSVCAVCGGESGSTDSTTALVVAASISSSHLDPLEEYVLELALLSKVLCLFLLFPDFRGWRGLFCAWR